MESAGIVHIKDDTVPLYTEKGILPEGIQHRLLYDSTYTAIARAQPERAIAGQMISVEDILTLFQE